MAYDIQKRLKTLRLIDDLFFACVFDGNPEDMGFVLRIILNRPKLKIKEMVAQKDIANIYGRGVIFDIFAVDEDGQYLNIEVQRDAPGASPRRARYNSSMMDFINFKKSAKFDELPDSYVIMITETDVLKMGKPLYVIERCIRNDNGNSTPFNDGSHIIYVNGEIRDETPLGRLMHDFFCINPADMHYEKLAKLTDYFKNQKGGLTGMSNVSYEIFLEGQKEGEKRGEKKGRKYGTDMATLTALKNVVLNAKTTVEEAMNLIGIPDEKRSYYAKMFADA